MSDPNGTEPQGTSADQPPEPPFDQNAVDAVSDADAALAPEQTPETAQSAPADAGVSSPPPAPQYAPPGGYGAMPHPPQGTPGRGYSTAPPTNAPHATAPVGYGATQAYPSTYASPQPYPAGSPGYAPPPPYPGGPQGYPAAPQGYPGGPQGYPGPQGYARQGPPTNPFAIASLICSLAGLITGISAIAGIVLGHIALNKIKETGEEGRPLAIAGLLVGYGLLLMFALLIVGSFAFVALMGTLATTSNGF